MADENRIRVSGIPDLRAALASMPDKLRRQALRNALAAGARLVRDAAKRAAPVLERGSRFRRPGTVRDAISVRTSKQNRRAGDVGVFVNVRPAKAGQRGARKPGDPFYWRWQEFGWTPATGPRKGRGAAAARALRRKSRAAGGGSQIKGSGFLKRAADVLPQALQRFVAVIGPQIERLNKKGGTL